MKQTIWKWSAFLLLINKQSEAFSILDLQSYTDFTKVFFFLSR